MKNILNVLIESQLEVFADNYRTTSRELFYDDEANRLIHPGEFGTWRESLLRELLSTFLPEAYGVSQGFIVAPDGEVSKQCDVIIYVRYYTPAIRTPEQQRFFPVESVVAVGEVKSVIEGAALRDALEKLVAVKAMRSGLAEPAIAFQRPELGRYLPESS